MYSLIFVFIFDYKARAKQCTDEDEEPSKSRCVATDRKTTSGEKMWNWSVQNIDN